MAAIHAASFSRPRPWRADEFADLLSDPAVFLIAAGKGFIIGRCILDEAELLTLAVAPEGRRQGSGRHLVALFQAEATRRGAATAFLEVAADNGAARALYASAGWAEAGRRRDYYGSGTDAIVMRLTLSPS
ncbi:ribosomal protein S18-alanine N-acetyltransferase [Paracoccus isoporae]|nr:ribosomal protein S18-alanine N-acetyltransferase [Paracoccus isoporae]